MSSEKTYDPAHRESKEDRFRRVAEARVNKIIKMIRLLGNCSRSETYTHTQEQVDQIFAALQSELDAAKARFDNNTLSRGKRFTLQEKHTPAYLNQPHISITLPDGSSLSAAAFSEGDYPAINLYWLPREAEYEEQIALAEFNPERESGCNLCIGVYQSDQDDTTYYEPYNGRKEST